MDKVQMAALAQKAKAGDRQAFTLLYRQLVGAIYAYFFVRLGAKLDAEDLTEQVFMKAFKNMHQFEGRSSFTTWVYAIARNVLMDFLRDKYKMIFSNEELTDGEVKTESSSIQERKQRKVENLLAQLPDKYSQVLRLRFLQNLSITETAQVLGISENNVKVCQLRALQKAKVLKIKDASHG